MTIVLDLQSPSDRTITVYFVTFSYDLRFAHISINNLIKKSKANASIENK